MSAQLPGDEHLDRLRGWRNRKQRDPSLGFVRDLVERDVARPMKHLGALVPLWETLLTSGLVERTRLVSLRRGVLTVYVADSATLYEVDQHLRDGGTQQLRRASKTTLNKVRLVIGPLDAPRSNR